MIICPLDDDLNIENDTNPSIDNYLSIVEVRNLPL